MISTLQRLTRRFALSCIIAGSGFTAAISTSAESIAHDTCPSPAISQAVGEQNDWCVWTESNTCNYRVSDAELHVDSPTQASDLAASRVVDRPTTAFPIASRTASSFETSLAAVAATACAHAGVSVEQLIEPFAMVGQESEHSVEEVAQFTRWWEKTQGELKQQYADLIQMAEAEADAARENAQLATAADAVAGDVIQGDVVEEETVSLVPFVDIGQKLLADNHGSPLLASVPTFDRLYPLDQPSEPYFNFSVASVESSDSTELTESTIREELKHVAMEEPIDVEVDSLRVLGQSILVTQSSLPTSDTSYARNADALVGSSAMIVSIEEVYMPYDLAAREYSVSEWLPLAWRPYSYVEATVLSDSREPLETIDEGKLAETLPALDRDSQEQLVVWARKFAAHASNVQAASQPNLLANQLGNFLLGQQRAATEKAIQLAKLLPVADPPAIKPQPVAPSKAGSQLLARAGVVPVIDADPDQVLNQWMTYLSKASTTFASVIGNRATSVAQIDKTANPSQQDAARR
jgi:hypothetical protein